MIRRALFALAVALATLVAWAATHHLPTAARGLATFLLVPLPVFMHWQARVSGGVAPGMPRTGLYLSSALLLWTLAALTAACTVAGHIGRVRLGLVALPAGTLAAWAGGTFAAGLAIFTLGRLLGMAETPLLRHLIPITRLEKVAYSALALTAGFAEELVFRGFLLWALLQASASVAVAVVVSSVLFGVLHAYQDMAGAARAAILGAVLAAPVVATGSVVPAMIAHAALDLASGLVLAKWLLPPSRA